MASLGSPGFIGRSFDAANFHSVVERFIYTSAVEPQDAEFFLNRIRALEVRLAYERQCRTDARVVAGQQTVDAAETVQQLAQLEVRNQELRRELDNVYSGRSWRLTSPLRWLLRVVRPRREPECAGGPSGIEKAFGLQDDSHHVAELSALIDEEILVGKTHSP